MALDPKIWGPQYWFVLHTIALNYPLHPNNAIKKKYYDFIQNLPLLIPVSNMANHFSQLINTHPVTPYLDSRQSFIKWMHYIHNKINISLDIPEKSLTETLHSYYELYKPKEIIIKENVMKKEKYIYILLITILVILAITVYQK